MDLSRLQQIVIEQLGFSELGNDCKQTLSDIANHGVSGGFGGFIYHSDTIKFFDDNRSLILAELASFGDDLGESAPDMVKNFGCLDSNDFETMQAVDAVLMDIECENEGDEVQVKNALSWWACEHVASELGQE